ncbi:MAG: DUF3014 domain-containing protein [Gammaproteobacteria bacterium]
MKTLVRAITAILLLGVIGVMVYQWNAEPSKPLVVTPSAVENADDAFPGASVPGVSPPATIAVEPRIEHPVTPPESVGALPALADSDGDFTAAVAAAIDLNGLEKFVDLTEIIPRLVVTIDNLPGSKVAVQKRLVKAIPGGFQVIENTDALTLDTKNFARYAPLVSRVTAMDPVQLAAVYARFYPLFQQAYADLGYPDRYFNDRLIAVIDHLLAAPDPAPPIPLVQPKVMYRFADGELEQASAGHKIMMRIGQEQAGRIKAWLRELRAAIATNP